MTPEDNNLVPGDNKGSQLPPDRVVFLAVLAAGLLIVLVGHLSTADLVADLTALAALYGAFHRS